MRFLAVGYAFLEWEPHFTDLYPSFGAPWLFYIDNLSVVAVLIISYGINICTYLR